MGPVTRSSALCIAHVDVGSLTHKPKLLTRALEPFQYTGISSKPNEIRLVTLLPGEGDDPVTVRIHHDCLPDHDTGQSAAQSPVTEELRRSLPPGWEASETWDGRLIFFNDALDTSSWNHPTLPKSQWAQIARGSDLHSPAYEALSYTWGSPNGRKAILVEVSGGLLKKLFVTKNLAIALKHLRYPRASRCFWIDAICINQQDIPERGAQVQMMPLIYRFANRVVVWLGTGSAQSHDAISKLHHLSGQVEILPNITLIRSPDAVEWDWFRSNHELPYDRGTWNAMLRLVERGWFFRVWVVQEIILSSRRAVIQCGNDTIDWTAFGKAILCLKLKIQQVPAALQRELQTIADLALFEPNQSYMTVETLMANRTCSDPRDRVYGTLGLISESLRKRIVVDYTLPVEEVYRQSMLEIIQHFGRLEVFRRCLFTGVPRAITAPSWVPDLLLNEARNPYSIQHQFSAGISRCEVRYEAPNVLEVVGKYAGKITDVRERLSLDLEHGLDEARSWVPPDSKQGYPGGGTFVDALAATVGGMIFRERFPEVMAAPGFEDWKNFFCGNPESKETTASDEVNPHFISGSEMRLLDRTLFETDEGHIGLGPLEMEAGDFVVILLGCETPMVLRQSPEDTYQIIGACLVHAFCDASCLLGPLPSSWTAQIYLDSSGLGTLYRFFNKETKEVTEEDPRLPPLKGWKRVYSDRTADDPEIFQRFKSEKTGEIINYDPRMSAEAFAQRGISLTPFKLI